MEKDYKIYSLSDPTTMKIRYIGVTTNSLERRLYQHKYTAIKRKVDTHVAKWIRHLYKDNLLPIISLIEVCTKDNWEEREKYWISFYDNLTNIREGGAGVVVNRNVDGIERSRRAHQKKVVLLNKDFTLVKEFDSITKCADYIGCVKTAVGNALRGSHSVGKGYVVLYKEDYESGNYDKEYKGIYKTVYQYDLYGNKVNTFKSINDAFTSVSPCKYISGIYNAIESKKKCGGFFWSFGEIKDFALYERKLKSWLRYWY